MRSVQVGFLVRFRVWGFIEYITTWVSLDGMDDAGGSEVTACLGCTLYCCTRVVYIWIGARDSQNHLCLRIRRNREDCQGRQIHQRFQG